MKTLVLGLGNPVLADDGVGWHVVRALRARHGSEPDVHVEACCRGGLALMERMVGYDRVVVIDAMRTGAPPGTLRALAVGDLPTQHSASAHDVSLATALAVGRAAGASLPPDPRIRLLGIEADDTETFSESCTPAVAAAVERAVEAVEDALARERRPGWP